MKTNRSINTTDQDDTPTRPTGDDGGWANASRKSVFSSEMTAKQKRRTLVKATNDVLTPARTTDDVGDADGAPGQPCQVVANNNQMTAHNLHKPSSIETSFKCPKCAKRFLRETSLIRHVASTHDLHCNVCSKVFAHRSALNRHRHLHGEKPFRCSVCEKVFSFSYYLQQHEARHQVTKKTPASLAKQIHCLVCNSLHPSRVDLWHHQRSCHGKGSESSALCLKCQICAKELTSSRGFRVHQLIHEGVRTHVCETCGASFYDKCHLQRHCKQHSGDGIERQVCGEKLVSQWHVQRHKRRKHPTIASNPHGARVTDTSGVVCRPTKVVSPVSAEADISCTAGATSVAE